MKSRYRGVSWSARESKWIAQIKIGKKQKFLGYFEYEEEAAAKFDRVAIAARGLDAVTNFSSDYYDANYDDKPAKTDRKTSKYKGVHWHAQKKRWITTVHWAGRKYHVGTFKDEEEAAAEYRRAISSLKKL